MQHNNWYSINEPQHLDSPVLLVFPERVKANIATATRMVGDADRLRPHIKTHKSPDVIALCMAAGISRFKCATIAEAELLGMSGAKDVLLAYQPLGPKLERLIALVKKYRDTQFSCITDNLGAAKAIAGGLAAQDLEIPVYIDLNVGMNRTGINPGKTAIELYEFISTSPGIRPAGIHAYDGHIRDLDMALRTQKCNAAFDQVEELKAILETKGLPVPAIVAGGSPTFPIHAKRKQVQCSPGTFVYWDKGYLDACPEQEFLPAAVLMTRIISFPNESSICTDLGHKSVAAENEIGKRVFFLNAHNIVVTGQSEEHLVGSVTKEHSYAVGDILYALPFHVCPTVALYERMITVENAEITGQWKNTARDRSITI